ncbi:MAG: VWA domain-containing protein [Luteitalea sp.]|nr:VWA domain-containing protein [Luteitalea sp.]
MSPFIAHLLRFARELREAGLRVTTAQVVRFVQALRHIDIADRETFRDVARCTLVSHRLEVLAFERVFARFWTHAADALSAAVSPSPEDVRSSAQAAAQVGLVLRQSPRPEPSPDADPRRVVDRASTYSAEEILRRKRFDELCPDELAAVTRMMQRISWRLELRRSRRHRPASRGRQPDWRRTIASAVRYDGEWISRRWRQRTAVPRPLVVIADVSGSMERYTRLLLTFLHIITQRGTQHGQRQRVETFVFGTRLTRITRTFGTRDIDAALTEVSRQVVDWAGGTRIGDSLRAFNRRWARRVLGRGAAVLVISDGWDRGDPALVRREVARLHRSCSRLVWLNPLIGTRDFAPRTRGLVAALPHVDDFLPVHNLASLEGLARHLAALPSSPKHGRPAQQPARLRGNGLSGSDSLSA